MMALAAACGGEARPAATPTPAASPPPATATPSGATPTLTPTTSTEADPVLVFEHTRILADDIGPRVSGTDTEAPARAFVAETLRSYGYAVAEQQFTFSTNAFAPVTVTAGERPISGILARRSERADAAQTAVFAGLGRPEEFPPEGLGGRIAIVLRGELTFVEKAQNAIEAGASALIVVNNEQGPLVIALDTPASIPVVGVASGDGPALRAAADAGATVAIVTGDETATGYNIVAKSANTSACDVVVGGHYDSVFTTGGADDNASGTAAVLEVARVSAARGEQQGRCFVLFGAEEWGLFGSQAYVDALSDEELSAIRLMVNLDVVGIAGPLQLIGPADTTEQARVVAERLGIETSRSQLTNGLGSDHLSFQRAGVPVLMLYRADDLIHTPLDNMSRILPESLGEAVTLALAVLDSLAPSPASG
jgi:aminopeptidase YwaD